jgi:glycosyltransferase involved in cell wall biosynthesis
VAAAKLVAHVLGPSRGGIRRHVRYLAEHPPAGYETLGVWGPEDLARYFEGIAFHPRRRFAWSPDGADVVHAHGFEAGVVAVPPHRTPVVLTVHIDPLTQGRTARSRLFRTLARLTAARAEGLIAVSERTAISLRRARVIPPPVEPLPSPTRSRADVRDELGTAADRTVVITVARLHPDKGLYAFIEAVDESGAEGWICGDGPLRSELERRAVGTSVRLLGYRDDVENVLAAADMFALPSAGEAYGIAVVEAISAGLPVVVSAAGAMPEIAGDAGLVADPGDRRAFGSAVRKLVSDADLRAELAARARKRPPPDNDRLVARIGGVYDEVVH